MTLGPKRCGIYATFRWGNLSINFLLDVPGDSGLPFPNRDPAQIDRYSVGEDPASKVYVGPEAKRALKLLCLEWVLLPADISQEELERPLRFTTKILKPTGSYYNSPLPEHLDPLSAKCT